ncbi:RusA family crossover junction endodeoxyribonuclease [Agrobacterium rubi]|nr:RusA family crossover junction endodeoxyribonuclease [Agrobacterium rubi]NTF24274.1 RusA family crossover junction endodeoxyribonuclease [Agrobacterium rubi]
MRISEAQFRQLGVKAREADKPEKTKKRVRKPKDSPGGGRTRHARIEYDATPFVLEIDLPYDPRPKERPRSALDRKVLMNAFLSARGDVSRFMAMATKGAITTYTPERTLEYENLLKSEARAVMLSERRKPFDIPLDAEILLTLAGSVETWPTSALDGDGDNLQKAVLDALNEIVFIDDRLIVRKRIEKKCGERPALRIIVSPAGPLSGFQPENLQAGKVDR